MTELEEEMKRLEEFPDKIREARLNAYDRGLHDGAIALLDQMLAEERLGLTGLQRKFMIGMRTQLAQDKAKLP